MKDRIPKEIRYYSSFTQDFEQTREQSLRLPEDYNYIRRDYRSRYLSGFIYSMAVIFGGLYCRAGLRVSYRNSKAFRKLAKGEGAFIYANHTQPVGDVFLPALACLPKRIYTVVSPANFGIPFIGRILPYLGALPISDTLSGMKNFTNAVTERFGEGKIITIYPEAHVWEYHKDIRPFSDTSFKYPVKLSSAVFAMTVTYQKTGILRRPRAVIYTDGPFYPDKTLSPREQVKDLHRRVYTAMCERSKLSNCEYIRYERITDNAKEKIPTE